jgi:hypothetical protein
MDFEREDENFEDQSREKKSSHEERFSNGVRSGWH